MKKNLKNMDKQGEKKAKNVKGAFFTDKTGLNLILSQKEFFFYKRDFLRKHPQIAKKNGPKSEKYKFTNIFTRFFQCGQFLLEGSKQNSMN